MKRGSVSLALAVATLAAVMSALTGCATRPEVQKIWIRTDGQRGADNPALTQQFELAKTACLGTANAAGLSGTQLCRGIADCAIQADQRTAAQVSVMEGCMADRGYMLVPADQAEAVATQNRAIATGKPAPVSLRPATAR